MKTKINKFMSLLVSMVMLISMITVVNVSAATIGGLTVTTSGTASVTETEEQVYSGDKAVKISSVNTSGNDLWYGANAELGITRGNKYSVEMYIYPINSEGKVTISLDGGTRVDVTYDGENLNVSNGTAWSTVKTDKSGWWKLATNGAIEAVSHATNTAWLPQFMIGQGFQYYVDSIKITPENSTTPVFNANFDTLIDYDARVDYMPKNFMALQSGATQMNISWRNPAAPAISSVKLYNTTDPKAVTEITPTTAFDTTADALNEYVYDGVSAGKNYTYRLDITFTDGTVKSFVTGCATVENGYSTFNAGEWEFAHGVATNKTPAKMNLDDNVYGKAAPSIHIVSNEKTFNSKIPTLMLYPTEGNEIKAGTKYKIRVSIKGNNMRYIYTRSLGWTGNQAYVASGSFAWNAIKTQEDWVTYETEFTANTDGAWLLQFQLTGSVEDFWIDDVEAYEYDETAAAYKETNIVASIGAVDDAQARPADVTSVNAEPAAFGAKLSWTAGADAEYIAVYDKDVTEYTPVAYVPASLGEVTIASLEEGETYNYIVKTVNAEGRESENGVEIQATAGGEELIETYYVPAKNFIATQVSATQISVSWRNPKSIDGSVSTITKAELYDADTNELIYTGTDMTANAISEYLDTDFTAGTARNYRLDLTYSDGAVKSQVAGYMPASAGYTYTAGSWQVISSYAVKPGAKLSVDDKVYRTAAPSIHVASNTTAGLNVADLRLKLVPSVTLDTTKTYRIEGYAKMNTTGYVFEFMLGNTNRSFMIHNKWNQFLTQENWVKFTKDIVPDNAASPIINFNLADSSEDFWIDDVTLYELIDGEGSETTGDNLLAGIGTCDDVSAAPAELTGVSAKNRTNEAMIKWGDTDAAYVAVYDNNVSEDIPVAYVPASMGYVDLKNLDAGKTYNYTVKAVNAEGRESAAGVAVSATPLAEALVISDYKTSASGNEVSVSVDLKNNSYGSGLTAQLFLAVYDGKVLEAIAQSDMTGVPQTELGAEPVTVSTKINVPEGKTMVMYLWNSLDGMKPLKACEAYTAE